MKRFYLLTIALSIVTSALCVNPSSKLSPRARTLLMKRPHSAVSRLSKSDETVSTFISFAPGTDISTLVTSYGGTVRNVYPSLGLATATLPVDALNAIATVVGITRIELSSPLSCSMDNARVKSNTHVVIDGCPPLPHPYRGTGVLVGVVDQEFQVSHIAFWSSDRSRYRVKRFLNQNTGRLYADSASIIAAKSDIRGMESGHATHVTGIAAGADRSLDYYGIAGDADLVLVGTTGEDADLTDGATYIMNYADSVGRPCVVNISMGGSLGSHDGTDASSRILSSLVKPGRFVVAAASNSGDVKAHAALTFPENDSSLGTFIELSGYYAFYYGNTTAVDVWGDVGKDYEISFIIYDKSSGDTVFSTPWYSASRDTTVTFEFDSAYSRWSGIDVDGTMAMGVSLDNNRPNVYLEYYENDLPSNCYPGICVRSRNCTVHMWTLEYMSEFSNHSLSHKGWVDGDGDYSIGTGVATGKEVISVGSYASSSGGSSGVNHISDFSSRGPLIDGTLKPEITAPGEVIVSAIPDSRSLSYYQEYSTKIDGKKYYYGSMQGTSMSSPYATGVIATWLQAKPDLTRSEVLAIFAETSLRDQYTGSDLPDNTWGYGKIDAWHGILKILNISLEGVENPQSDNLSDEVVVYTDPTSSMLNVAFLAGSDDVAATVIDMGGRTLLTTTLGDILPGTETSIPLTSLTAGVYLLRLTTSSSTTTVKFVIK